MFTINKGAFEGNDVVSLLNSLGQHPKNTQKAISILESCTSKNDIVEYWDDIKAVCSEFRFENSNLSEKEFINNNEDLLVNDFLIQLQLGQFDKDERTGAIKVAPMQSTLMKAVNGTSSIQVSSEAYETTISRALMKEVEAHTYARDVIPSKVNLGAKKLTMPVQEDMVGAAWVESAAFMTKHSIKGSPFGTDNSTGEWQTLELKERTYKAFKLATKGYINDETEEDAIILLTPILRQALVEAIADSINKAVLNGDGDGKCVGFLQLKTKAEIEVTGKSLQSAAVKGTSGRDVLRAKHMIDPKCRKGSKLVLIASQQAISDLEGDENFQDVSQVGTARASKLVGWVGNFYNIPVVEGWNEDFGWKDDAKPAAGEAVAVLVAVDNFRYFEQREVKTEYNRNAEAQRNEYFITTRMNMAQTRYPTKAAVCVIKHK